MSQHPDIGGVPLPIKGHAVEFCDGSGIAEQNRSYVLRIRLSKKNRPESPSGRSELVSNDGFRVQPCLRRTRRAWNACRRDTG